MNEQELRNYAEDCFGEARNESDPKKQADLMRAAKTANEMADQMHRAETEEQVSWLKQERTFTWKEVLIGIATPLATIGAALIAFAGTKAQANAMAESRMIEMQEKRKMLEIITEHEKTDIVSTSGVKALNELNKL